MSWLVCCESFACTVQYIHIRHVRYSGRGLRLDQSCLGAKPPAGCLGAKREALDIGGNKSLLTEAQKKFPSPGPGPYFFDIQKTYYSGRR